MNLEELIQLLRNVGASEATVTSMATAFEMGVEWARKDMEKPYEQRSTV